jgi:hypothetical protein
MGSCGRVMMSVGLTNRQRLKLPTTIFSVRIGNTDDKMEDGGQQSLGVKRMVKEAFLTKTNITLRAVYRFR